MNLDSLVLLLDNIDFSLGIFGDALAFSYLFIESLLEFLNFDIVLIFGSLS